MVRGGDVRLQQVFLNLVSNRIDLVSNGIDAMEGQEAAHRIKIATQVKDACVTLSVRDTGPGLCEPDCIFDPFYSTKQVSQDGMGLGLSISYGLVQSFAVISAGAPIETGAPSLR